ncbi:MAG TPA: DUF86 domain-containing protein [Gemmatimonadales bacterium]|nr:DUF86 domain-containing protein [Gemmatimonadales bacterium]
MAIDKRLVTRKLALIIGDMADLARLARMERAEFLKNRTHQLVAERLLERVIGRMIDVNYHVITERDGVPPRDFHPSFTRLGTLGVLSVDLAQALAPAAGLRNRLAHEYNEIDYGKLHAALAEAETNVPRYLEAMERFTSEVKDEPPA